MNVLVYLNSLLNKGEARTVLIKKNALATLVFQGFNIATTFALIPLVLNYLNPLKYGIWLTLSSVVSWFTVMDMGLGNGLKNKLSESLAKEDYQSARVYISSTYALLFLITASVYLVFLTGNFFIDWTHVFNTPAELKEEVSRLAFWIFTFFIFRNAISIINIVFVSNQKAAYTNMLIFFTNLISLVAIFVIPFFSSNSLFLAGFCLAFPGILVPAVATFYYFKTHYKHLRPNFKLISFEKFPQLFTTGISFFVLQLISIVIFTTDNMIITQLLGPEQVAPYNIAFKYFNIVSVAYTLAFPSLWTATTNAYVLKDFDWMKKIINKMLKIWSAVILLIMLMILVSPIFYDLWVGKKVEVPLMLSILMALYVMQTSWNGIFINIINGIGKIRLQLIVGVFCAVINIPLAVMFVKYFGMGVNGVMLGTLVSLLPQSIAMFIQCNRLINNKATGILNK